MGAAGFTEWRTCGRCKPINCVTSGQWRSLMPETDAFVSRVAGVAANRRVVMESMDLESENASDLLFDRVIGRKALRHVITEFETIAPTDSAVTKGRENGNRRDALYQAVIALSRSIAGRTDLRSLLSGVAESLRLMVR